MQKRTGSVNRVGQKRIYTVYDHMYGDFPAKDTVYTPYIHINLWFWPTISVKPRLVTGSIINT